jgi:DNA-binding IscR family transcriptional regulator
MVNFIQTDVVNAHTIKSRQDVSPPYIRRFAGALKKS